MKEISPLVKSSIELGRAQMKCELIDKIISVEIPAKTKLQILEIMRLCSADIEVQK